jgi:hypothetical protein
MDAKGAMFWTIMKVVHGLLWILATVALSLTVLGWRWSLIIFVGIGTAVVIYGASRTRHPFLWPRGDGSGP